MPQPKITAEQRATVMRALALQFTHVEAAAKCNPAISERSVRNILAEPGARAELQALKEELRSDEQRDAIAFLRQTMDDPSVRHIDRIRAAEAILRARIVPNELETDENTVVGGEIHVHFGKEHLEDTDHSPNMPTTSAHNDRSEVFAEQDPDPTGAEP
jgi:hypothetical protein